MNRHLVSAFLLACLVLMVPQLGSAASFSNIVAFGDSLTDNGPETDGHGFQVYSDGTVWVDAVAAQLGLDLADYAYGGATTGWSNYNSEVSAGFSGLQWQINNYDTDLITENTLVSVWAGANDFLVDFSTSSYDTGSAVAAATNIGSTLEARYEDGAR